MKILGVDTAAESLSVAVVENGVLTAESTVATGQTHSKQLMSTIQNVIVRSGLELKIVDGFAVTRGPGSFTGLRIGVSTVKGLAIGLNKPLVGVSSLDALAHQSPWPGLLICPFLDARKNEVYYARYRLAGGSLNKVLAEQAARPEAALEGIREACLFSGGGAVLYRDIIIDRLGGLAHFVPRNQNLIRASTVASLGSARLEKGLADDVDAFVPRYIRRSDAQVNYQP